ncbi:MAG TPA: aminopeptidase, partial [Edaphobacter sp.]|nr:aminopeptidase [Edaphobacter sp.]
MSVMEAVATTKFASLAFEEKLDRLAEVAVKIGLGLRAGQELIVSAPIQALPLVRRITEHAYKAGALLVTTFYSDDPSVLSRYEYAQDASFDFAPTWLQDGIAAGFKSGAARLAIAGANPALLAKQDPAKVARANVAMSKASKPAMELITRHEINWTIVACATPEWAKLVFPGEPENVAVAKLWEAIFVASRVAVDDPVLEWREHGA